jgi:hypothetical protein
MSVHDDNVPFAPRKVGFREFVIMRGLDAYGLDMIGPFVMLGEGKERWLSYVVYPSTADMWFNVERKGRRLGK